MSINYHHGSGESKKAFFFIAQLYASGVEWPRSPASAIGRGWGEEEGGSWSYHREGKGAE